MDLTRLARNLSTGAVTMIAAWSSWSHMVHVALRFGERPEVAYVLPISVDGMLVVASTAMVEDKRAGRNVRWSARVAFGTGMAASVAANIAAAHPTPGARIVAAWPALAMLLVVEILSRSRTAADATAEVRSRGQPVDRRIGDAVDRTAAIDGHNRQREGPATLAASASRRLLGPNTLRTPRRRGERTAAAVSRARTERPLASPADIAASVGVSERHVRRLLTSGHRPSASSEITTEAADERSYRSGDA